MYKGAMEYSKSLTLINIFVSKNKIQFENELQTRIRSYLEYIWQEKQNMNDEEQFIRGIIISVKRKILSSYKVMIKKFSRKMIQQLLGQILNKLDDSSLYIITKGEVKLYLKGFNNLNERVKRNSFKFLYQGDYFGEFLFFYRLTLQSNCNIQCIQKRIKNKQLKQTLLHILQVFCYSCQSNQNLIKKYHYLHYFLDKVRNYILMINQEIKKQVDKRYNKNNHIQKVKEQILKVMNNILFR
ncbi:unnamed protein product [Paramecium sonneborni]|uniref:Cyclic nucleotide-binding domain-containing protein n=1 Tax=Paramecium sonneborni TaxID=65129 RepID=A0A8S1RT01_9CILI|nr:unnamed protein product [Paramecium sonneborni]